MRDTKSVREMARAHRKASADAPSTPERDRLIVGRQWCRRTDGQLLTVKIASAREIQFNDGNRVTGLNVCVDFEHVVWVD